MEKIIDLHIHTNFSDGALSPFEIIDEAVKNGVSIISIADHDTIDAYSEEFYNYALNNGIKIINGVEISTKINKCGIHILGYNFEIDNNLKEKLVLLRNARHNYLFGVSKKLQMLGFEVDVEKLDKIEAVTKAHIASDVINNPINCRLLKERFGYIPNKGEFIENIMNEGKEAYVKKETISPKEAANLIREAGGTVILAHPVAYKYEDGLVEEDILKLLKEIDADGIEAYYIYIDKDNNKINEIIKWKEFAKKNKYTVTIGSDFHNDDGIHPKIGLIDEKITLSYKDIDEIVNGILN